MALAAIGVGYFVSQNVNLTPPMASTQAEMVDSLYSTLLGIASAIFVLVEGGLIFAVIRFRRRHSRPAEPATFEGSLRLEFIWTVIPAIIVIWLAIHSADIVTKLHETPPDSMAVRVIAQQFSWQFEYPEYGIRTSELHVPEDRPVALELTSMDVIHSFWVPAFRIKQDALPDLTTHTTFTAVLPGTYPVACAELCGPGHSIMRSQVIVHSADEFDQWLQEAGG